jgi:DNA adenine methylase
MKVVTPLRYPGGKARLASTIAKVMEANGLIEPIMAEPYAGGAGASLDLLFSERVRSIAINDLDYRIYAFWWSVLNRTDEFLQMIDEAQLRITEWRRYREVYRNPRKHKRLDVGFATFYLNRTNRSGILVNGGPIGGVNQTGKWGIDARFTKQTLMSRISRIGAYRERISLSNLDAIEFFQLLLAKQSQEDLFFYLDPPYYVKGGDLYLSTYTHEDHVGVARAVMNSSHPYWVVTYDDVSEIRTIYKDCQLRRFALQYTAQRRRVGDELLIAPRSLRLPRNLLNSA